MLEQAGLSNYTFPWATTTEPLSSDSTGPIQFIANGPSNELSKAALSFGILPSLGQS